MMTGRRRARRSSRSTRRASPWPAGSSRGACATTRPSSTPGAAAATTRSTSRPWTPRRTPSSPSASGSTACTGTRTGRPDPEGLPGGRARPADPLLLPGRAARRHGDGRRLPPLRDARGPAALLLPRGGHGGAHDVPRHGRVATRGGCATPRTSAWPCSSRTSAATCSRTGAADTSTCPTSCSAPGRRGSSSGAATRRAAPPPPRARDRGARCERLLAHAARLYRSGDAGMRWLSWRCAASVRTRATSTPRSARSSTPADRDVWRGARWCRRAQVPVRRPGLLARGARDAPAPGPLDAHRGANHGAALLARTWRATDLVLGGVPAPPQTPAHSGEVTSPPCAARSEPPSAAASAGARQPAPFAARCP